MNCREHLYRCRNRERERGHFLLIAAAVTHHPSLYWSTDITPPHRPPLSWETHPRSTRGVRPRDSGESERKRCRWLAVSYSREHNVQYGEITEQWLRDTVLDTRETWTFISWKAKKRSVCMCEKKRKELEKRERERESLLDYEEGRNS